MRRPIAGTSLVLAGLLLAGCSPGSPVGEGEPAGDAAGQRIGVPPTPDAVPPESEPQSVPEPRSAPHPPGTSAAPPPPPEPPSADELAGVLSREVAPVGSGATVAVPGSVPAPGTGEERRVRVEIEGGLALDGAATAGFVLATLNDPRSWAADGLTFSRTDGDADIVVVLASPETSARMCHPLRTNGRLSCRDGPRAIITTYRWINGMEDYGDDLTGYRQYVVNHEVGHVLGHGHVSCPATGRPAPVMQQQTKDVDPCVPNPWPHP